VLLTFSILSFYWLFILTSLLPLNHIFCSVHGGWVDTRESGIEVVKWKSVEAGGKFEFFN